MAYLLRALSVVGLSFYFAAASACGADAAALAEKIDGLIQARLDETRSGKQAIAAADVLLHRVSEANGKVSFPENRFAMVATDGAFDQPSEDVSISIDTTPLTPGRYYVVVRGRDTEDHGGTRMAAWLKVTPR